MRLLLHTCCAACLSGSRIPYEKEMEVVGFWYAPNIHPWTEYEKRLHEVQRYSALEPIEIVYEHEYPLHKTLHGMMKAADPEGKEIIKDPMGDSEKRRRCAFCYRLRLERTARKAKELGFDGFSSTLLISKYQDHEQIKKTAEGTAEKVGIPFVYRDLREFWNRSLDTSRRYGIYRQQYCGCIFSEQERYFKDISRHSH